VRYRESELLPKLERMGVEVQLVTAQSGQFPPSGPRLNTCILWSVDGLAPDSRFCARSISQSSRVSGRNGSPQDLVQSVHAAGGQRFRRTAHEDRTRALAELATWNSTSQRFICRDRF